MGIQASPGGVASPLSGWRSTRASPRPADALPRVKWFGPAARRSGDPRPLGLRAQSRPQRFACGAVPRPPLSSEPRSEPNRGAPRPHGGWRQPAAGAQTRLRPSQIPVERFSRPDGASGCPCHNHSSVVHTVLSDARSGAHFTLRRRASFLALADERTRLPGLHASFGAGAAVIACGVEDERLHREAVGFGAAAGRCVRGGDPKSGLIAGAGRSAGTGRMSDWSRWAIERRAAHRRPRWDPAEARADGRAARRARWIHPGPDRQVARALAVRLKRRRSAKSAGPAEYGAWLGGQ